MRILVTGGAGYIGSHASRLLARAGHDVWCYDNFSRGHRQAALPGRLIEGEVADRAKVEATLRKRQIDAVMHFAAFALVGESVAEPHKYYQNNVVASLALLEAMRATNVNRIVFSSTTATYGVPDRVPITEETPQRPINPYGFSKLVIEQALLDYAHAYDFGFAALRYFNAAGASPDGDLGEVDRSQSRLIPLVLQVALGQREAITIFGDDYPTPDGTCIRDYIHVDDLGSAHLKALERLSPGQGLLLNLGTGRGHSVRQVVDVCRRISGREIPVRMAARAGRAIRPNSWPTPLKRGGCWAGNRAIPSWIKSSRPPGAGTARIRTVLNRTKGRRHSSIFFLTPRASRHTMRCSQRRTRHRVVRARDRGGGLPADFSFRSPRPGGRAHETTHRAYFCALRPVRHQHDELLRPQYSGRGRRASAQGMGAFRYRAWLARHGFPRAVRRHRRSAGADGRSWQSLDDPGRRRFPLEHPDRGLGHGQEFLANGRPAPGCRCG